MLYGDDSFDPKLIIAQIVLIQVRIFIHCSHTHISLIRLKFTFFNHVTQSLMYVVFGGLVGIAHTLLGLVTIKNLNLLFDYNFLSLNNGQALTNSILWIVTSIFGFVFIFKYRFDSDNEQHTHTTPKHTDRSFSVLSWNAPRNVLTLQPHFIFFISLLVLGTINSFRVRGNGGYLRYLPLQL